MCLSSVELELPFEEGFKWDHKLHLPVYIHQKSIFSWDYSQEWTESQEMHAVEMFILHGKYVTEFFFLTFSAEINNLIQVSYFLSESISN